ncbi:hypothetical protein ABPG72_015191 [Tetrahymena utriculariae]
MNQTQETLQQKSIYFLLILCLSNCNQVDNQYLCIGDYLATPCNQNLNVGINYFCPGTDIFKQYSSPTIQKFTIAGWFFLKGTINQNYNILTVLENNVLLFKIEYNLKTCELTGTLISKTPQPFIQNGSLSISQQWYFINFKMEVLVGTQLNLYATIYTAGSDFSFIQSTSTRSETAFQASQMIFDYGNGQSHSEFSCLVILDMYIYWDSDLSDSNEFTLFNDLSTMNIYLKWNYDTFYAQKNLGYLIQANNPNGKLPIGINRNENFVLKNQEQIVIDFINALVNRGFVLTFHFKLVSQFGNTNKIVIMEIINYPNSQLFFRNNQLYFLNTLLTGIQLNKWNQVTIICNQITQYFYFILNDDQSTLNQFSMNSQLQFCQILFGDSYNSNYYLYLNYIRVYEGIFLSSSPSCFMLEARVQQQCIICKNGYLIDYQNNLDCVTPSSNNQSTIIDNVKDWFPKQFQCPKNMILNSQNACVCLFQYYRVGDDCFQCKNYCQGCVDANTCIQMDPQRQQNGKCLDGLFDDGYNCYSPKYNIMSRINYIKTLYPNNLLSGCIQVGTQASYTIDKTILLLQKGKGFFFSFSVKVYDAVSKATIAFFQDGAFELFTIIYEMTTNNGYNIPSIALYVNGSRKVSLIIMQQSTAWIGLWTDFYNINFYIFSEMIMQYQSISVSSDFSLYYAKSFIMCWKMQFIFRNNIDDPTQVRYLMNYFTSQISLFELDFFNLPTSNSIKDKSNQYSLIYNSKITSNRFKGIQFTQIVNAQISGVDIQQNYPSFSCYIFIEELNLQQMIFQIDLDSSQLQYHIVPYGTKAFVRICQFNLCLDTKYSMLNINEIEAGEGFYYQDQNLSEKCFLFRNIQQMECLIPKKGYVFYQDNLLITEDECNNFTIQKNSFHIVNPSAQECINTYLSSYCQQLDDTSNSVQCIKCQYIGQDPGKNCECQYGSYLNLSHLKCSQCSPQCQACVGQSDNCLTCKQTNQNPPTCQCLNLQEFLDENYTCQTCSNKCQTCYQKADNCLTCSTDRANPPFCNCAFQQIEVNGNCQPLKCENKCSKCDQSTSNCIECNTGRVKPPNCNCNFNYIENQDGTCSQCLQGYYYDQKNNICQQCSIQCNQCINYQSNCSSCNSGFELQNNKCNCSGGTSMIKKNNQIICLKNMNVSLSVILNSTFYYLVFKFDYDIEELNNYYLQNISQLIQIAFQEVPKNLFEISDPTVQGNTIKVKLNIYKNFQTQQGWVQFIDNTQFISLSQEFVLNQNYTVNLIKFEIGPFLFDKNVMDGGLSDQIINIFTDSSKDMAFDFIKQFQIILYILNTAQPSALFLLINTNLPPNLYKFYQVIGLLVYPDVVNYQSTSFKQNFQLFYMSLNQTENLDAGINYFCSGKEVFKQYSSPNIQKFAFSGWLFLKGEINQNYNIITVLENNVLLFKVEYNMFLSIFSVTMISKTPQTLIQNDALPLQNKWYFATFKMEVLIGTQLNLYLNFYSYPSSFYLTQTTKTRSLTPFQASKLIFDYGNGQLNSQYSCLAISYVFICWDSDLTNYNQFTLFNDISALGIYLKWNYDTFYTQYNQGDLIQVNYPNGKIHMGINRNAQFVLKSQEQIITDFINAKINQGFISQKFYWILNDDSATLNFFDMNSVLQFSQILFGDTYDSKYNLYLNYLRVYEGIFLSNNPSCFMLQGRNEYNSIICRSGYLIDYQNNMTCVSPSSRNQSTLIDNYYRQGDECFLCKNYCQGCINSNTSILMDPKRLKNGKCQDNLFDDGYNCLTPKYNIQSRLNYIKTLSISDIKDSGCALDGTQSQYLMTNSILQVQKGRGFSFSFVISFHTIVSQATIAFLQDGGSDLFTITQEITFQNGYNLPSINLYVINSKVVGIILNSQYSYIWIHFWTDFDSAGFYIYSDMIMQYKNIDVNSQFSSYIVQNPSICVGKCGSQLQNIYSCAMYSSILYIYDLKHIYDPTQVRYLINLFTKQISLLKLDFFNLPTSNSIKDESNKYSLVSNSNFISNRFKGIKFTQNLRASISRVDFQQNYPSFSCYIYIEELNFQQMIFEIDLGSSQLLYHIVPNGTKAFIRICQLNLCYDTKYSMLNKNEIEAGEGFYYQDQNLSEKCFLFRNIEQMECLIPKKGYVFYKDNYIITEDECNHLTQKNNSFHIINPSTQECIDTKLSQYGQQLDETKTTLSYIKCQYKGQNPNQNCQCFFRSYLDQCSPQCQTCFGSSDNCITCKYTDQNPPNSDKCTTCSINRSNPPTCNCTFQHIEINGSCQQLKCEKKCLTCDQSQSNCNECNIGRINPPICDCKHNYVENQDGTCSQCIFGYYYDYTKNNCQQCSNLCSTCQIEQNSCTSCKDALQLINNHYYQTNISQLISVKLSEIPENLYDKSYSNLQGNLLKLKLQIHKSFSALHGWVKFLDNTQFLSTSNKFIHNSQYKFSFIRFQIGPFLFDKSVMDGGMADQIINKFQDSSNDLTFNFINQFQIILYILNTAQPSALFLLLNANLPPNLYKFYQVTSFFLLTFAISLKENLANNQYLMINDVQFAICDSNQSNINPQFVFNGSDIFKNYNSQTINSFAIVGWFALRGYTLSQDYNLVTVTENSNLLFKVDYNNQSNQIYSYLLGGLKQTLQQNGSPIFQNNSWYLSIFKIEYQNSQVNFSAQVISNDQNNQWFSFQTYSYPQPFKTQDLLINVGKQTNINYASCVMIKYLNIFWDTDFNPQYLFQLKYDLSSFDNFIVWFYDMFYTHQNPGYAIQSIIPNGKLPLYLNNYPSQFFIQDNEFFLTDFLNNLEQRGFIFTFHFKINTANLLQTIRLVTFKPNSSYYVEINNNQLMFSGQIINGIQLNKWNQLTFIYKIKFVNQFYLLVNDNSSMQISIPVQPDDSYQQVQFGSQFNLSVQIFLAYLRSYQGTFATDNTSCYLLAARKIKSCIICRYPYLMDYQNNFNCVLLSSVNQSTLIDNVKDWFPKQFQCQQDMILDNNTGACKCRFQYYRYQNQCFQCKNYCTGCIDANTCIQMDINRQPNGECLPGLFDDGYSCIDPQFSIKSRLNFVKQLEPSDLGSFCNNEGTQQSYYIRQQDLKLIIGQGFFFGFSFLLHEPKDFACIGFLSDGSNELILIMFKTISTEVYAIQFYVQGNQLKQIQVNINQEQIWVAVWTDFVNACFYIQNYSLIISTGIINISSYFGTLNFQNAFLCVGKCVSVQSSQGYLCAIYQPIGIIYQMETPINGSQISNLITLQTSVLGQFTIKSAQANNQISQIQDQNTSLVLNFNSVLDYVRFKGIKLTNGNNGYILNLPIQNTFATLFCNIFIEQITYQVLLFQINYNMKNIEYNLVPFGTKAFIRICLNNQCRDTKYAMLNLNDYNFFGVIFRNLSLNKQYFWPTQFEVICNYQTEILQFQFAPFTLLPSTFYILPQTNTYVNQGKFIIYLNNLILHQGDGSYYEDRNQQENGFIFVNVYQMECIFPKQGFTIYQNKIISVKQCIELTNQTNNLYVVDQSNFQCVNTNLPSACQEFSNTTSKFICTKCRYANADTNNSCQCPDGTYLDLSSQSCQKCSPRCLTCQFDPQNCTTCKYNDQSPPTCNCNNSNYFLNLNFECQPCSQKCKTCQISSNQCITCAENRLLPFCDCNSQYKEINQQCQQIKCDDKCLKCEYSSSNCLQCNSGRINPPLCNCQNNFKPNSTDGTCTECPSGQYYDSSSQSCQSCILPCLKCINKGNQCLVCEDGFQLVSNQCTCPNGNSVALLNNGLYECIQSMEVILNVNQQNGFYYLNFIFDKSIKQLAKTYQQDIQRLINVSFSEIPGDCYSIDEPLIQGNMLKVKLNILKSFQSLRGLIKFVDCSQFVSISEKQVLNTKYQIYPLTFEIGPFLFHNQIAQQQQLNQIKDYLVQNTAVKQSLQQFQFILYILNTAQPTVLPLLLKIQFPPNLYQFYQVIGLLIYPDVADYQSKKFKDSFQLYYLDLNKSEVYLSNNFIFQRLGFSNSCLVNSQGIILKYFCLFLVFIIAALISSFYNTSNKFKLKVRTLKVTIFQRIILENESNILLFVVSFLVQTINNDSSIWAVRYGYYVGLVLATFMIASITYSYYQISSKKKQNKEDFSYKFVERINDKDKNKLFKFYFISQQLKKYLIILILFFFQNFPIIICVVNGVILLLSGIQTIVFKPYKKYLSRNIKILGEFTFSLIWFLHISVITIEKKLYDQIVFDEKLIEVYFNLGYAIISLLLFFNILFMIEILFQCYLFIKSQFLKRQNTIQQQNDKPYQMMSTDVQIRLTNNSKNK